MEDILECHSRQSLVNSMVKSIKIDNVSIVNRFDTLGKKKMSQNTEIEKKKLLKSILQKERKKILIKAITRWRVRSDPKIIKQALHSILNNGPVSKVVVFHRLFHDVKRKQSNKQKTLYALIQQQGENSQQVKENVVDYIMKRKKSDLVAMAKLHDSLSMLGKNRQKQILENIKFKISEAQFSAKHHALKNSFESINNSIKNHFKFFKDVRINRLLNSILRNKAKQYLKIWFVKANQTVIPSNISSIDRPSFMQQQPSVFWNTLLQKHSQISKPSQISYLGEQSKLKQNNPFKVKTPQNSPRQSQRKMFIDEQLKRNIGGLMLTNSYSYMSIKQSQFSTPKKKSTININIQIKHLNFVIYTLIKMRLYHAFSSIKQPLIQTPASSKHSIQCQQIQKAGIRVLQSIFQKKLTEIQKQVFIQLMVLL